MPLSLQGSGGPEKGRTYFRKHRQRQDKHVDFRGPILLHEASGRAGRAGKITAAHPCGRMLCSPLLAPRPTPALQGGPSVLTEMPRAERQAKQNLRWPFCRRQKAARGPAGWVPRSSSPHSAAGSRMVFSLCSEPPWCQQPLWPSEPRSQVMRLF